MEKKKKETVISDVIKTMANVGDTLNKQWEDSKDLKVCDLSIKAYSAAISAAKAQLIYKKLTGAPDEIEFLKK
jgi:hypothetical protein